MSALSDKALEIAIGEWTAGVRGGVPPFAKYRGTRVDEYQRAVGLPLPPDPTERGFFWCAAAVYWCFAQAADNMDGTCVPNPCPRTGGAILMWDAAQDTYGTHVPNPGAIFVLDRGGGHGHVGFVVTSNGDGTITTCEPDTANAGLSATGDAWGRHDWDPREGKRGTLLGYLSF